MYHLRLFSFYFAALGVFILKFFGFLKDAGFLDVFFMLVYCDCTPPLFAFGALI
jgi:hypothetical protein